MSVRFVIVARCLYTGERFECYRWTRDAESGIARTRREAPQFGAHNLCEFSAEAVN